MDFYAPATAVQSIMEHLSRDIDVIRPNVVKHPLTQEVKECVRGLSLSHSKKNCIPQRRGSEKIYHILALYLILSLLSAMD